MYYLTFINMCDIITLIIADGLIREGDCIMKKIALLILCITILMCLVACNQGNNQNPTPEHTHSFGEWSVSKNATCTEDGIKVRYCDCGEKQSENIPLKGHTKVVLEAIGATCTTEGKTEGEKCSDCGEILLAQEKIDALGHNEVVDAGTDATCTSTGLTEGKHCSVCNEITVKQEIIPVLNHTEVIDAAVPATCTSTGLTEGKHCSVCNTVLVTQATTAKIAHTYTDKYDESCNECGFIRDAECAHINTAVIPAIDPTCTSTGLTEGSVCTRCEEILVAQGIVPSLPHTYGDWVTTKVANCGQDGEMTRYCNCGAKQTEVISGSGMHGEVIDPAVAPTCAATGLTEGKHCPYCNTIFVKQEVIPTLEHTYNTTYSFDNSFHWYGCRNCGAKKDSEEHQVADDGMCSVCDQPIGPTEGILYDISDDGTYAMVVGYTGTAKKIKFATEYKGLPVQVILQNAFKSNGNITTVVIPDSVTTIGERAFYYCSSISSVVIGDSVTTIGERAFYSCGRLSSVVIPDSVTTIGNSAFSNCNSLSSVVIPDSVTTIGDYAFAGCNSLSSVVIGDSVTTIGDSAFSDCYKLSSVVIPDSVTTIGSQAFSDCDSLSSVVIGDSVTYIGDGAFADCARLSSVIIGDSVTTIGSSAFRSCGSLSSVVIGDSMTTIGSYAFEYCYSLKNVYYTGSDTEWGEIAIGDGNGYLTNATIHYNYLPGNN